VVSVQEYPVLRPTGDRCARCRLVPFYRNSTHGNSEEWATYVFLDNDVPCLDLQREGRYGTTIVYRINGEWFWGWEWYAYCDPDTLWPHATAL
jgi:hypothetical protein